MAAQTITELFGSGASLTGTTLTIDVATSFTKLNDPAPSASQIAAALLDYWITATAGKEDDDTAKIVASTFQPTKAFVTRNNVFQIEQGFTINTYIADNTAAFDPDNVD